MTATGVLDPPKSSTPDQPRPRRRWPVVVAVTAGSIACVVAIGATIYVSHYDPVRPAGGGGRPIGHFVAGGIGDGYYRVTATEGGSFEYGISLANNGRWPVTITDPGSFHNLFVSDDVLMGTFHHGGTAWAGLVPFQPTTIHQFESLWVVYRGHFECGYFSGPGSVGFSSLALTFRAFGLTRHEEIPLEGSSLLVASNGCPAA
jgi:hypothetical protein